MAEGVVEAFETALEKLHVVWVLLEVDAVALVVVEDRICRVEDFPGISCPCDVSAVALYGGSQVGVFTFQFFDELVALESVEGLAEIVVDVSERSLVVAVMVDEDIESVARAVGEVGVVVELLHGVDQRSVLGQVVGMGLG